MFESVKNKRLHSVEVMLTRPEMRTQLEKLDEETECTPLEIACRNNDFIMARLLIVNGAVITPLSMILAQAKYLQDMLAYYVAAPASPLLLPVPITSFPETALSLERRTKYAKIMTWIRDDGNCRDVGIGKKRLRYYMPDVTDSDIEYLISEGYIYVTCDETHYRSAI